MSSTIIGHKQQITELRKAIQAGTLAHAHLFIGEGGVGKRLVAHLIAKELICQTKNGCGTCHNCKLIEAGTHPDLIEVKEGVKDITIGEIRGLKGRFQLKSSNPKVALIDNAEKMNIAAANSMLKMLEEPPEATYFFLVTSRSDLIPATIRSRCQKINFSPAPLGECTAYLMKRLDINEVEARRLASISNGRIGFALSFPVEIVPMITELFTKAGRPSKLLEVCERLGASEDQHQYILFIIARLLRDALVYRAAGSKDGLLFPETSALLADPSSKLDQVIALEADLDTTYNKQLMFEQLLLNHD